MFEIGAKIEVIQEEAAALDEAFVKEEREKTISDRPGLLSVRKFFELYCGNVYLKKKFPLPQRSGFTEFENQERAINHYWNAYKYAKASGTGSGRAAYAISQAMEGLGASSWRGHNKEEMCREASAVLGSRLTQDLDRLNDVLFNEILALCSDTVGASADVSRGYLYQARSSLRELPNNVKCFSALNKIRLSRPDLLGEFALVEKILRGS